MFSGVQVGAGAYAGASALLSQSNGYATAGG